MTNWEILTGDVRQRLADIPDGSVRCCVTSPPYWGLRDYGNDGQIGLEQTPEAYVAEMVEVFREVRRTLTDDGSLWLNLGDSYKPTGNGSTKKGFNERHFGKKFATDKQGAEGGHVDRSNLRAEGLKPKDLAGIPWRVAFALQADGWWLRQDIIWHKPNPMPESVTDRCTKAHEYVFLLTKSPRYYYDHEAVLEPYATADPTSPSYRRNGKSDSRRKHNDYCQECDGSGDGPEGEYGDDCDACEGSGRGRPDLVKSAVKNEGFWKPEGKGRNRRSVWSIATKPFKAAHFAVMPEALAEPCVLAGSAPGDLVLDPFTGSGTVAVVALRNNRRFIGVELNPEYVDIANDRINTATAQGRLL